jgi:RNase P/RNase MRP subunit POP5
MATKLTRLKLKPSARDKRRYLLISEKSNKKIEQAILDYVGVLGFAKSGYMQVQHRSVYPKISGANKKIIKHSIGSIHRKELENIRAALAFAKISIAKVSGTLKGLGVKGK